MSLSLSLPFLPPRGINSHTAHSAAKQDREHLWEFYDPFKLCGPATARHRLWANCDHMAAGAEAGRSFQHWTAPKILE